MGGTTQPGVRPGTRAAWLEAGVWLALAAVTWGLTLTFDEPLATYRFGAASWPRTLLALIAVVAACQLVARLGWLGGGGASPGAVAAAGPVARAGTGTLLKRAGTFALPLVYVFLLPHAGYYALTPFFLGAYMYLLGERRLRHLVGTVLLIYGLVLLAFTRLFFVPLPVGVWPGFYDFGNWFLSMLR